VSRGSTSYIWAMRWCTSETTNFSNRLAAHISRKEFDAYSFLRAPEAELNDLEAQLIAALAPPLNVALTGRPTKRRTGYVGR
jgi:hypothetical protein